MHTALWAARPEDIMDNETVVKTEKTRWPGPKMLAMKYIISQSWLTVVVHIYSDDSDPMLANRKVAQTLPRRLTGPE